MTINPIAKKKWPFIIVILFVLFFHIYGFVSRSFPPYDTSPKGRL